MCARLDTNQYFFVPDAGHLPDLPGSRKEAGQSQKPERLCAACCKDHQRVDGETKVSVWTGNTRLAEGQVLTVSKKRIRIKTKDNLLIIQRHTGGHWRLSNVLHFRNP